MSKSTTTKENILEPHLTDLSQIILTVLCDLLMDELRLYHILAIAQCFLACSTSRILGIFPEVSKSHFAMHQTLMKSLATRGHQVTVLSFLNETESTNTINYTSINLGDATKMPSYVDSVTADIAKDLTGFYAYVNEMAFSTTEKDVCICVYSNSYIRDVLRGIIPAPQLLIVEFYHLPCYNSLADKFHIPVIASSAPTHVHGLDYIVGNPVHPAYWPFIMNDYTQVMDFYERLINWLQYIVLYYLHNAVCVQTTLELDQMYVGNKDMTINKLYRRTSLVFFNSHFSFLNRPSVPNVIEVGGIHIGTPAPLRSDIHKFIEEAEEGVILFSLGSALKMSSLSQEKINVFSKVFSKIQQRILWRSDLVNLTDVSPNVMIKEWLPQRDILEHKNVRAFISHGGIFGLYEAIHTGTPVIGIPLWFDQFVNVNILREKGVAICLDFENLDYETLLQALRNIFNDSRYYVNMQKLSVVFNDRPMSPLQTAVYWSEYIIRHKGATHMRVRAADMPFYEFLLLDVIGFVLASLLSVIWIIYYSFKSLINNRTTLIATSKETE